MVTGAVRLPWLAATAVLGSALGFASIAVLAAAPDDSPWRTVAAAFLGLQIAATCTGISRRLRVYRSGWLQGRAQMVASLAEASRRGMTLQEWAVSQAEKDARTMGLTFKMPEAGNDA